MLCACVSVYSSLSPSEIVGLRPGSHGVCYEVVYAARSAFLNRLWLRLLNQQDYAEFNEDTT